MPKKKVTKDINVLEKLVVVKVPIESVKPNSYNANRQSDRDFELLCRSISEDGFTQPIIVHKETMEIVDGEHRWRACKALGWTECEIVLVEMSEAQRMIATLRHNRARGQENIALAADVLQDLNKMGSIELAKDSLMLDDAEIRVMLEDISGSAIHLRAEGDQLDIEDIKNQLKQESTQRTDRTEQEKITAKIETSKMQTLALKIMISELINVKRVLEALLPKGERGQQILALVRLMKNDPEAQSRI